MQRANERQQTPLHLAFQERLPYAVRQLLEAGAPLYVRDDAGTPQHHGAVDDGGQRVQGNAH